MEPTLSCSCSVVILIMNGLFCLCIGDALSTNTMSVEVWPSAGHFSSVFLPRQQPPRPENPEMDEGRVAAIDRVGGRDGKHLWSGPKQQKEASGKISGKKGEKSG